ncbi:MAG: hypothetical protein GWO41_01460 [candidate division Zixibacteria bacterium]|nr:hypothetical protein [candidate division Zixibacteria bacterium]NIR65258.1 hypothetical protein [candidate division Zixibacteria bacterium]NIS14920.1 hypothetical protein [candidate division Zixibacteria bacterium]NIS47002.1 hypothetical protein [candidate division Zixibacteria bacterium]NIT51439.1 hypothetical protein [candidate division Zixibacteria bacterium]
MKISSRILLSVLIADLLILFSYISAEGLELVSFSYEIVPEAEIDLTGVEEEELKVAQQTFTAKLAIPVLLSGQNTMLLHFLTFRWLHQSYDQVSLAGQIYRPEYLYSIKYGLVFIQRISPRWQFAFLLQPSMHSDFIGITSEHIRLRAGFIFEKNVNGRFSYGIGAGYSDDFGDEKVLPVFRLNWKPGDNWRFKFDIPQKLELWYLISPRIRGGIEAKVTGAHFRIGENISLEDGSSLQGGRIKYSILNAGPSIGFNIYKGLDLSINAGRSFYRRLELYDVDNNQLFDSKYENSFFLKVKMEYNVGN